MKKEMKNDPSSYADYDGEEPIFILRASDKYAPTLVWLWSTMHEVEYKDRDRAEEARNIFIKMLEYEAEHGIKVAGLAQASLAAIVELIRVANFRVQNAPVDMSMEERFRLFLATTKLEGEDENSQT